MTTELGHPADQPLSLRDKILIGALVGVCIGIVSALVQHHATNLVRNGKK